MISKNGYQNKQYKHGELINFKLKEIVVVNRTQIDIDEAIRMVVLLVKIKTEIKLTSTEHQKRPTSCPETTFSTNNLT